MESDAGDHQLAAASDEPNHDAVATYNGSDGSVASTEHEEKANAQEQTQAGDASLAATAAAASASASDVSPHVALASSSSLVLPLTDPILSLDPDVSSVDELVAMLRGQITDLAGQVTSLNSKLVKSYTQRGEIEDDLHDTQEQHALLKMKVAELERDRERWTKEIEAGGWVEKTHVQGEMQRLMTTMVEETKSRETAVQAHAALETEIENLTSNLFTEANKMVAFERLARARAEEKTRSVEEAGTSMQALLEEVQVGLKDTVLKLEERDAQVADLKRRLAAHGEHVEEDENVTGEGSNDNDLGGIVFSDGEQLAPIKTRALTRSNTGSGTISPSPMAAPRLLTSVLPYQEFLAFINYLRQTRITALSRPPEQSSYPALGGRSFATDPVAHAQLTPDQLLAPHLLLSTHLSQAFLKRCVEEDSDPALRLDIAPGLGFLSRRSVANAIVDGSLVIEPLHSSSELPSDKCALCGCGLDRWLANSGISKADRPVATPAQTAAASVNSTMRKISSSFFSRSSSSAQVPSASSAPALPSRSSSTNSTADDPAAYSSSTAASHHPHDAFLLAHVFRTSDKSQSQRYAICPSYCLPRLRAVCEFWTYVRVLLRGLLLEESFRFGQIGDADTATAPSTPARAKPSSGLGISDVHGTSTTSLAAEGPGADIQAKDFEAEDTHTDDGRGDDATKAEQQDKEADAPAPAADGAGQEGQVPEIVTSAEEGGDDSGTSTDEQKQDEGSESGTAPGTPTSASASVSRSGSIKPPRPARSTARNSPKPPAAPSPPASPSPDKSRPALPARKAVPSSSSVPPPPPPRRNASHALSAADSAISSASTMAAGWEDRCWSEVIRLKEAVFWTRVAAIAAGGEAVSSRGARVWQ